MPRNCQVFGDEEVEFLAGKIIQRRDKLGLTNRRFGVARTSRAKGGVAGKVDQDGTTEGLPLPFMGGIGSLLRGATSPGPVTRPV